MSIALLDMEMGGRLAKGEHTVAQRVAQLRRLLSVREWRAVRQEEVAAVAGVKQPTWSGWEDGATPDLRALARLGASSDWVLHEIGEPFLREVAVPELPKAMQPRVMRVAEASPIDYGVTPAEFEEKRKPTGVKKKKKRK